MYFVEIGEKRKMRMMTIFWRSHQFQILFLSCVALRSHQFCQLVCCPRQLQEKSR